MDSENDADHPQPQKGGQQPAGAGQSTRRRGRGGANAAALPGQLGEAADCGLDGLSRSEDDPASLTAGDVYSHATLEIPGFSREGSPGSLDPQDTHAKALRRKESTPRATLVFAFFLCALA